MTMPTVIHSDTNPTIEQLQIDLMRQATPWRKLEIVSDLFTLTKDLALAGLHSRDPEATEAQVMRRLAALLLGHELALRAYGPELDFGNQHGQ